MFLANQDPNGAKGFSVYGTDGVLGEVVGGYHGSQDLLFARTFEGIKAFDADSIDQVDWAGKTVRMDMSVGDMGRIPDIRITLQRELTEEEIREIERELDI